MRKILKIAVALIALLAGSMPQLHSQNSGVSQILTSGGTLYNWQSNDGTYDYYDGNLLIDSSGALTDTFGNYYGPSYHYDGGDYWSGYYAIGGDGLLMGMPQGIQVVGPNPGDVIPNSLLTFSNTFTDSTGSQNTVPTFFSGSY